MVTTRRTKVFNPAHIVEKAISKKSIRTPISTEKAESLSRVSTRANSPREENIEDLRKIQDPLDFANRIFHFSTNILFSFFPSSPFPSLLIDHLLAVVTDKNILIEESAKSASLFLHFVMRMKTDAERSQFVVSVYSQTESVIPILKEMDILETSSVAFFIIQIFSFVSIKQIMIDFKNVKALSFLSDIMGIISTYGNDRDTALLPAPVFEISKKKKNQYICSSQCFVEKKISESLLFESNLFRCKNCSNLFSLKCTSCGSCPIKDLCWGCAYRSIAALSVPSKKIADSIDQKLIAIGLIVASGLPQDSLNFFTHAIGFNSLESIDPTIVLPFRPSREFSTQLIKIIAISEKAKSLRCAITKAVLLMHSFSTGAIQILANAVPVLLEAVPCVEMLGSMVIAKIRNTSASIINAGVNFLKSIDSPNEELIDFLYTEKKITLYGKELIFSILTPNFSLHLLDYLETSFDQSLFDALIRGVDPTLNCDNSNIELFIELLEEISGNFFFREKKMNFKDEILLIRLIYDYEKISIYRRLSVISQISSDPFSLAYHLITTIVSSDSVDDPALVVKLEILKKCKKIPLETQLWNKLAHFIQIGDSSLARASVLLMVHLSRISLNPNLSLILDSLVSKCSTTLELRQCWIVGSILENDITILSEEKSNEIANSLIQQILHHNETGYISVLGFIALNPRHREQLLLESRFIEIIEAKIQTKSILVARIVRDILKSSICAHTSKDVARPSSGITCRPLASILPVLSSQLIEPDLEPEFEYLLIDSVRLMEQIGIINPRNIMSIYFYKYIYSEKSISNFVFEFFFSNFANFRNPNFLISQFLLLPTNSSLVIGMKRFETFLSHLKKDEIRSFANFFSNFLHTHQNHKLSVCFLLVALNRDNMDLPENEFIREERGNNDYQGIVDRWEKKNSENDSYN